MTTAKSRAKPSENTGSSPPDSTGICKVAILGFGTVGSSVARILAERRPAGLRLTHICNRDVARKKVDWLPPHVHWTADFKHILSSDVDVVVEVIGGLQPAGDWVRKALTSGKSVVTANKQLIAHHGSELTDLAQRMQRSLAFGASVAGGIPVISGLQEGLAGDELFKICGILNGTCNYILSQIQDRGVTFSAALSEAQKLGYAEADPADDIEGWDARAKLAILARIGLNSQVNPQEIACQPISIVQAVDFEYARILGCTIRQISRADLRENRLVAGVQPTLVALPSPFASIQGSQNLVVATGKFGGETVFAGHGAGGNPTAVAVVSDLIAIAQTRHGGTNLRENTTSTPALTSDFTSRHYLRFTVADQPGIIAEVAEILSKGEINIDSVLQKPGYPKSGLPFVITLESCPNSVVQKALGKISKLPFFVQPCVNFPILD